MRLNFCQIHNVACYAAAVGFHISEIFAAAHKVFAAPGGEGYIFLINSRYAHKMGSRCGNASHSAAFAEGIEIDLMLAPEDGKICANGEYYGQVCGKHFLNSLKKLFVGYAPLRPVRDIIAAEVSVESRGKGGSCFAEARDYGHKGGAKATAHSLVFFEAQGIALGYARIGSGIGGIFHCKIIEKVRACNNSAAVAPHSAVAEKPLVSAVGGFSVFDNGYGRGRKSEGSHSLTSFQCGS